MNLKPYPYPLIAYPGAHVSPRSAATWRAKLKYCRLTGLDGWRPSIVHFVRDEQVPTELLHGSMRCRSSACTL